jgi:hypothetical protein
MAPKEALVQLPAGGKTVTVKLINPVNFGPAILKRFMAPDVPGLDTFKNSPSFSFLLEHPSGRKLVFDLGIRKDYKNHAPKIADYLPTTGYTFEGTQNVVDILEEGGVNPSEVEAVIWRLVRFPASRMTQVDLNCKQSLALGPHWRSVNVPPYHKPHCWTWFQEGHAARVSSQPRLPLVGKRLCVSLYHTISQNYQLTVTQGSGSRRD